MMVIAVIFAGIIAFIGDLSFRRPNFPFGYSPRKHRDPDREREGGGALVIILIALAVITISWGFSVLIRFALSRTREFLADAGAAELDSGSRRHDLRAETHRSDRGYRGHAVAHAHFFHRKRCAHAGARLVLTHPPVDERVAALVAFAGGVERTIPAPSAGGPWTMRSKHE